MNAKDMLTEERRARMAAERLLEQKEAELSAANRMLSRHAISLSENLIETREEVEEVRGENVKVRADLDRAHVEVDIAKRRLWNSLQAMDDGFAVFDADSRLVIANDAYLLPFDGLECIRPGAHYSEIVEAALAEGVIDLDGAHPAAWREQMMARWASINPEPRVIRLWNGSWMKPAWSPLSCIPPEMRRPTTSCAGCWPCWLHQIASCSTPCWMKPVPILIPSPIFTACWFCRGCPWN